MKSGILMRVTGRMNLHVKLFAAFLILALTPVAVVGVYAYRYMYNSITQRVEEGMVSSIRQLQIAADGEMQRYEQVLYTLMYDQQMQNIFSDEDVSYYDVYYNVQHVYRSLLMPIREMNPELERIGVYTDNRMLRPTGDEIRLMDEIRDSAVAKKVTDSHAAVWDMSDGNLTVMGSLMRTRRQTPENIVYLEISPEVLLDFDPGDVSTWSLTLMDGERVLAQKSFGGFTAETAGDRYGKLMTIRQPLDHLPWNIQFSCPYDELHINLSSLTWMCILAVIGSFGAIVIVSNIVSRSITRRISALNASMARVEEGTLTEKPTVQPWEKDEIAELTEHFGNMLSSLNNYIQINYENRIIMRDAEMKMLQAQINPHFLYNTLSMINWMALEHDETEISETLMQLSQFYRMSLTFSEGAVTVRDEIENITCYLDLQARLHEHSFDIIVNVEEGILDCRMIGMVLQPIVENAIIHSIDLLRDRKGCLEVSGYRQNNGIAFDIRDNGQGMSDEQFEYSLSKSSKGYGLKNVNDRLRIAYGSNYGLTKPSVPGEGTLIHVFIPEESDQDMHEKGEKPDVLSFGTGVEDL